MERPPRLIVLAGLPGTGKSTLARLVAQRLGAAWLRVDTIEASILEAGIARSFESGLAAYVACRRSAADQFRVGLDVVIDAVNAVREARETWRELSVEHGAERFTVWVTCSDTAEHRRRVESRTAPTPPLPAPTWREVEDREFQPWDEAVFTLDNVGPVDEMVGRILEYCETPGRAAANERKKHAGE